ncbi:MAG: hypothetical protein IT577_17155 [Verrucomicrobiae bacterium]|nr:hypothetical protein [Verrucomicrobiae bacterium]
MRRAPRMLRRGILLVLAAGVVWCLLRGIETRRGWLSAIGPAGASVDNCPPMLDDSAVAFVQLHRDLDSAVKRGQLARVREDSAALARHLTPVDPIAAAAALHLAESGDLATARQRFEQMDRLLRDPARPRASDHDQPSVIVAPAIIN